MARMFRTDDRQSVGYAPVVPSAPSGPSARWRARAISTLPWAVLLPVVILLVGGWAHRWVSDDAFIDFRVVHNLLAGHGPVFNVGERVEVYTDPLWIVTLTIFYGIVRFVPIEWWSVICGLAFSGLGVLFGGLAVLRLGRRHGTQVVLPMGMLSVAVVAGVWDFTTSGLETGLVLAWMGSAWWMLVRARDGHGRIGWAALVAGLGFTIHPDLVLVSLPLGAALVCLVVSRSRRDQVPFRWRKLIVPVVAFAALPMASELFRMVYFGMLVPNTALAKDGFGSDWAQGWTYLRDFARPYWLWVPLSVLVVVTAMRCAGWWKRGQRLDCVVVAAPFVGGVLETLYVVKIGGDFMHARMLLPAFFAMALPLWIDPKRSEERWLPLAITLGWAGVCLVGLRYTQPLIGPSGIANERSYYIFASTNPHPITLGDYGDASWAQYGEILRVAASKTPRQELILNEPPLLFLPASKRLFFIPASSALPLRLVAPTKNLGLIGEAAGPNVYLFDQLSLANPVSSHFVETTRGRPGHENVAAPAWMVGRFAFPGDAVPAGVKSSDVAAVRGALACQPLSGYVQAITSSLSLSQMFSDLVHSFTWTTMSFSGDPRQAFIQLCEGGKA